MSEPTEIREILQEVITTAVSKWHVSSLESIIDGATAKLLALISPHDGLPVSEEEIQKALGQFRLALNGLLEPLNMYGQQDYAAQVVGQIEHLAWQLHWRLEGVDTPYEVEKPHW